jgi:hypothetical protein
MPIRLDLALEPVPRSAPVNANPESAGNQTAKIEDKPATAPPARSYLEIAGAVPGAVVRLDGQPLGETDGNGAFRHEVTPGPHVLDLSKEDYLSLRLSEQFRTGKIVHLSRGQVAMTKTVKPLPAPDPKQIETQEWDQIANSTNPDDFERFARNHPAGTHQEQARNRAAELRQQLQATAARQLEQSSWDRVDKNNKEQLQEYLSRFPGGAHAQDARARIAELDRQAVDRQAADALAAQRLKETKDRERAKAANDEQAIIRVLKEFESAYNRRDLASLQRLWNGVSAATYRQQFHEAKELSFQLQANGQPVVSGDTATTICTRTLTYRGQSGGPQTHSERVKVTLNREGSGWVIRSVESN